jgi:hypothetical protein
MTTLLIKDLPKSEDLDAKTMSAVRGGFDFGQMGHNFDLYSDLYANLGGMDWTKVAKQEPAKPAVTQSNSITQGGNLYSANSLIGGSVINAPIAAGFNVVGPA